jgi:hypothetical protein
MSVTHKNELQIASEWASRRAQRLLPRRLRRPTLTRAQALASHPLRNQAVEWKEAAGGEVVIMLKPRADRLAKWLFWIIPPAREKHISLDEVGSEVWRLCDGRASVDQIIRRIGRKYKLNQREAETSTTEFLRRLGKRRLVGFAVPEKSARTQ